MHIIKITYLHPYASSPLAALIHELPTPAWYAPERLAGARGVALLARVALSRAGGWWSGCGIAGPLMDDGWWPWLNEIRLTAQGVATMEERSGRL